MHFGQPNPSLLRPGSAALLSLHRAGQPNPVRLRLGLCAPSSELRILFGELSDSANLNRMYYETVLEEESSARIGYEPVNTDTATMRE